MDCWAHGLKGQSYKEYHDNSTKALSADAMAETERQTDIRRYFYFLNDV